jgi:cell division protein FtsQ
MSAVKVTSKNQIRKVEYKLIHLTDGNDLITVEEIKKKLMKTYNLDFVGVEIDRIDLGELEALLKKEAFIVDADAYLDSKNQLHIEISQRTPILRVLGLNGSNYYLDAEGVRLPLSEHFTARVPIISGAVSDYKNDFLVSDNTLKTAFRVVKAAREDEFVGAWLEGIHIQSNRDLWLTGNVGDFKIILGDDRDIDHKFYKMKTFMKDGLKITGWKNIESINLKYDSQVVVKSPSKV